MKSGEVLTSDVEDNPEIASSQRCRRRNMCDIGVWLEGGDYLVFRDTKILNTKTGKFIAGNKSNLREGYPSHFKLGSYHRVMAECFLGGVPEHLVVNHINGDKNDYSLDNLEVVTPKENVDHAFSTGLNKGLRGEYNSQAELKEFQVFEIYDLFLRGRSNEEVSELYGLHPRYVSLIRHGKRWKHLYEYVGVEFPKSYKFRVDRDSLISAKALVDLGVKNSEVAKVTGIEKSTVSRIKTGELYREFFRLDAIATTIERAKAFYRALGTE